MTALPPEDVAFLTERYPGHVVTVEAGMVCVVIPGWFVPAGFSHRSVDLLLRLVPGFPDVPPDMWWTVPTLTLASGRPVPAADLQEVHLGRTWQRWSRHLPAGAWASGKDTLQSYLAQVRTELERTAAEAA